MATQHYDAVVIGAGQAGVPLATTLAKAGRKTTLVEREHVGGTCINEGCTPTKDHGRQREGRFLRPPLGRLRR
jgi:pyruvate/2-oxoglutarate dehydrogenase complex dihydrolipoamide dehydrogenase (E3) component